MNVANMNMTSRSLLLVLAVAGASGSNACTSVGTGELNVRWSIASTYDPSQCGRSNTPTIHIDVFFVGGGFAGEYAAPCANFATSVFLGPGRYTANARLVDPAGNPRTTTVSIPAFLILSDTVFVADVDFPASSFF